MRRPVGFLVWNPSRSLPTMQHETLERAEAEAERLRSLHPDETFWVMSPIRASVGAARGFSDGKTEGLAQAHAEIMLAEGRAERALDELHRLRMAAGHFASFKPNAADYQATVADCLLWFDGFNAAHHERAPFTPDREKLRRLNQALQGLLPGSDPMDDEVPF